MSARSSCDGCQPSFEYETDLVAAAVAVIQASTSMFGVLSGVVGRRRTTAAE